MNLPVSPLISVIIPTYNHAHFLDRALGSVFNQTYKNWEIIIVDNHSTDHTDDVVKAFLDQRIRLLKIHNNGIIAASRNMGVRHSQGEWIAFLDSDDWWKPNKLEYCVNSLSAEIDLVYHDMLVVRDRPTFININRRLYRQVRKPVLMDLLIHGNTIPTSSVLMRKDVFIRAGGMDEDERVIAVEDFSTWLKVATFTDSFLYVDNKLGFYGYHEGGLSRKDTTSARRIVYEKYAHLIDYKYKLEIHSKLIFDRGKKSFLNGNTQDARRDLAIALMKAPCKVRLKAFCLLVYIYFSSLINNS